MPPRARGLLRARGSKRIAGAEPEYAGVPIPTKRKHSDASSIALPTNNADDSDRDSGAESPKKKVRRGSEIPVDVIRASQAEKGKKEKRSDRPSLGAGAGKIAPLGQVLKQKKARGRARKDSNTERDNENDEEIVLQLRKEAIVASPPRSRKVSQIVDSPKRRSGRNAMRQASVDAFDLPVSEDEVQVRQTQEGDYDEPGTQASMGSTIVVAGRAPLDKRRGPGPVKRKKTKQLGQQTDKTTLAAPTSSAAHKVQRVAREKRQAAARVIEESDVEEEPSRTLPAIEEESGLYDEPTFEQDTSSQLPKKVRGSARNSYTNSFNNTENERPRTPRLSPPSAQPIQDSPLAVVEDMEPHPPSDFNPRSPSTLSNRSSHPPGSPTGFFRGRQRISKVLDKIHNSKLLTRIPTEIRNLICEEKVNIEKFKEGYEIFSCFQDAQEKEYISACEKAFEASQDSGEEFYSTQAYHRDRQYEEEVALYRSEKKKFRDEIRESARAAIKLHKDLLFAADQVQRYTKHLDELHERLERDLSEEYARDVERRRKEAERRSAKKRLEEEIRRAREARFGIRREDSEDELEESQKLLTAHGEEADDEDEDNHASDTSQDPFQAQESQVEDSGSESDNDSLPSFGENVAQSRNREPSVERVSLESLGTRTKPPPTAFPSSSSQRKAHSSPSPSPRPNRGSQLLLTGAPSPTPSSTQEPSTQDLIGDWTLPDLNLLFSIINMEEFKGPKRVEKMMRAHRELAGYGVSGVRDKITEVRKAFEEGGVGKEVGEGWWWAV